MFQDGESGSSADSSDEMEHGDENSELPERFGKPPQKILFPAPNEDRTNREEPNYNLKPNTNSLDRSSPKPTTLNNDSDLHCKSEPNLIPMSQITNILSSRNAITNNFQTVTTKSTSTLTSSLPLMVPNSITSANLSVNITPNNASGTSNQFQALPLLVQTPGGVGYASTPDGMVLALLQGANISQPQLVALPTSSIGQTLPKSEPSDKNP